ncbi:MAG: hypothetical protein QM753_18870 [Thermomicrobiales bacterium]
MDVIAVDLDRDQFSRALIHKQELPVRERQKASMRLDGHAIQRFEELAVQRGDMELISGGIGDGEPRGAARVMGVIVSGRPDRRGRLGQC